MKKGNADSKTTKAHEYIEEWMDWAKELVEELIRDFADNKFSLGEGMSKLDNGWKAFRIAQKAKKVSKQDWQNFSFPAEWQQHLVDKYSVAYGQVKEAEQLAEHFIGLAYHGYNIVQAIALLSKEK